MLVFEQSKKKVISQLLIAILSSKQPYGRLEGFLELLWYRFRTEQRWQHQ